MKYNKIPDDNNERLFDDYGSYVKSHKVLFDVPRNIIDINILDHIIQQHHFENMKACLTFAKSGLNIKSTNYQLLKPYLLYAMSSNVH